jgi:predicted nuclease of predicted toxin-antitoxin system
VQIAINYCLKVALRQDRLVIPNGSDFNAVKLRPFNLVLARLPTISTRQIKNLNQQCAQQYNPCIIHRKPSSIEIRKSATAVLT